MATVIAKQTIFKVLFFACIAVPYLNTYELTLAIWLTTAMVTLQNTYSVMILRMIGAFSAILVLAVTVGLFKELQLYEFIKDITYLLKPIIGLLAGYQLCKDYMKNPMKLVVNTGLIIALIHFITIVYAVGVLRVSNMHELRGESGYFSDFEVYALIILIFRKRFNLNISQERFLISVGILAVSVFMYLARTNFIQFGILFIALKGHFVLNRRSIMVTVSAALLSIMAYGAIYYYNPQRSAKGLEALLFKIKNSPIEAFKSKINVNNWKDFNDNYRSYETLLTLKQVSLDGPKGVIFGKGAGSSIDLHKKVWLQTSYMRYIPFLHNGIMTVYLKAGIVGVLLLIYSVSLFFRRRYSDDPEIQAINYILIGTGIYLILSYWVFMGFYFPADTKSVVIGFLIAHRENLIRKKNAAVV